MARVCAWHDWNDLKRNTRSSPTKNPGLNRAEVICFHDLKAASETWLDPTVYVSQSIWKLPARLLNTPVDRNLVVVAESFDNHEQHHDVLILGSIATDSSVQIRFVDARRNRVNVVSTLRLGPPRFWAVAQHVDCAVERSDIPDDQWKTI